jgi:hypothetical protein
LNHSRENRGTLASLRESTIQTLKSCPEILLPSVPVLLIEERTYRKPAACDAADYGDEAHVLSFLGLMSAYQVWKGSSSRQRGALR